MNEFVELLVSNVLEIVIAGVFLLLTTYVTPWFINVAGPFIKNTVIPWLEEKRLYGTVKNFVEAAEKMAENEKFDKKAWVISQLESKNIKITPEVEAYIETACKEIDMIVNKTVDTLTEKE